MRTLAAISLVLSALGAALASGCASGKLDQRVQGAALRSEYGAARSLLAKDIGDDPSDRAYLLDRMRLLILTLADGQPGAVEVRSEELYALLRRQGLNADRTAASAVLNEGVKIWKGEPFEQALAYAYIGVQKAMEGEWDNARAAAQSSLFLLRDFGENERGEPRTTEDVAAEAARAEAQGKSGDEQIDHGYTPVKTTFTLGYLLNGVANVALGRPDEASDNFNEARRLEPGLGALCDVLRSGDYNTVLVVDYGRGPEKQSYGPDDALVRFVPRTASTGAPLNAWTISPGGVSGNLVEATPPAIDVNRMASSLMWNSLEGVRKAKSAIGDTLLIGGVALAAAPGGDGDSRKNRAYIGLGAAAVGALLKLSSHADTRYCEFLPQRTYLVPLKVEGGLANVALEVQGDPASRLLLAGLSAPKGRMIQLRYVRMGEPGLGWGETAWRTAGRVEYANDNYPWRVPGDELPYVFGGRCVRTPTAETMERYHEAGHLEWMTSADLANIYREEGLTTSVEEEQGRAPMHVLEGGTSLVCPLPGTVGYQRVFGRVHPPYQPRSQALKDAIEHLRATEAGRSSKGETVSNTGSGNAP